MYYLKLDFSPSLMILRFWNVFLMLKYCSRRLRCFGSVQRLAAFRRLSNCPTLQLQQTARPSDADIVDIFFYDRQIHYRQATVEIALFIFMMKSLYHSDVVWRRSVAVSFKTPNGWTWPANVYAIDAKSWQDRKWEWWLFPFVRFVYMSWVRLQLLRIFIVHAPRCSFLPSSNFNARHCPFPDDKTNGRGFHASYEQQDGGCGGYFTAQSGTIQSPSFPNPYPASTDCEYFIDVGIGQWSVIQ